MSVLCQEWIKLISRVRALLRRADGDLAVPSGAGRPAFGEVEVDLDRS